MSDYEVSGKSSLDVGPFLRALDRMDAALANIERKISSVDRAIDNLGRKDVTAKLKIDTTAAEASITRVEKRLDSLRNKTVRITTNYSSTGSVANTGPGNVDTRVSEHGADQVIAKLAEVSVAEDKANRNVTVGVDDRGSAARTARNLDELGKAAKRENDQFNLMGTAIAAGSGLIYPLLATAAGAGAGALGVLSVGLSGTAAFALAVKGNVALLNETMKDQTNITKALAGGDWTKINEAYTKYNQSLEQLGPNGQRALTMFQQLTTTWTHFGEAVKPQVFDVMTQGMVAANNLLAMAVPVAKSATQGFQGVINTLNERINTGQFDSFFNYLDKSAGPIIHNIGTGVINFGQALTNVIRGVDPLTQMVISGFDKMSQSTLKWSETFTQTSGWHKFVQDVQTYGPQIWATMKQITVTALNLVQALAPLGSGALSGLRALADLLNMITKLPFGGTILQLGAMAYAIRSLTAPLGGMQGLVGKVTGVFSGLGETAQGKVASGLVTATAAMEGAAAGADLAAKGAESASAASDALSSAQDKAGEASSKFKEKLGGISEGAKLSEKAMGGLKAAGASLMGLMGGPWGMALTGAVVLFSAITDAQNKAKAAEEARINTMKTDIQTQLLAGNTYSEAGQKVIGYQRNVNNLRDTMNQAHDAFLKNTSALNGNRYANEAAGQAARGAADAYHKAQGEYDQATKRAMDYLGSLTPMQRAQAEADAAQEGLTEAIKKYGPASDQAAQSSANFAEKQRALTVLQTQVAIATQSATDNMLQFVSAQVSGVGAAINLSNAQLAVKDAQKQVNDLLKAGKGGTDEFTAAENNLESQILNAANAAGQQTAAMAGAAGSQNTAAAAAWGLYQNLKQQADMAGGVLPGRLGTLYNSLNTTDRITQMLTGTIEGFGISVYNVPGEKYVRIDAPTQSQEAALQALGFHVLHLPNGSVYVSADTWTAEQQIDVTARDRYARVFLTYIAPAYTPNVYGAGPRPMAVGGPVRGEGTSTSDSILARLSNGEYVIKAASVDRYGTKFLDALNEGRISATMPAFSNGGPVTIPSGTKRGGDGGGYGHGVDGDNIGMYIAPGAVIVNNFHPTDTGKSVNKELARLGAFGSFGG